MKNKSKIIIFSIIILISVGGLFIKGYLNDEVYVLNQEQKNTEDISSEFENSTVEETKEQDEEQSKATDENESKEIGVKKITVYISGQVKKEGVVTLDNDKRLADAIEKLGGLTKNADTNNINLAMKLDDEMHYIIPKKGEKIENTSGSNQGLSSTDKDEQSSNTANNEGENNQSDKINLNTADLNQLDEIPGVGPATANKILSYREENGNFKSINQIKEVSGIGDKKFENMKDFICVK